MAELLDLKIFGDKALQRKMDGLAAKIQKQYMRKALRAGAKVIQAAYKAHAPVFTGKLKSGIKVRVVKRSRGRIGVMVMTPTRAQLGIPPDSKWYYPAVLEFGGVTKSGRVIPALAFGRRALQSTRSSAIQTIRTTLWQLIASGVKG